METHTVGSIGSNVQFIPFRSGASRVLVPRQELEPLVKGEEVVVFLGKVLSDLPVIGRRFFHGGPGQESGCGRVEQKVVGDYVVWREDAWGLYGCGLCMGMNRPWESSKWPKNRQAQLLCRSSIQVVKK